MTSFVTWSPSEVKQHRQPLAPRWLKNRRWMYDQLVLPKKYPRKKQTNTPLLQPIPQVPREISKKKGTFQGAGSWAGHLGGIFLPKPAFFRVGSLHVFFFFGKKNPGQLIFVDPKKILYDKQLELPTQLSRWVCCTRPNNFLLPNPKCGGRREQT